LYSQLVRVPGWEELRVTEAAQQVQRSAFPEAYERWVEEATVLSEALVGQAPGAVSCTHPDPLARGRPRRAGARCPVRLAVRALAGRPLERAGRGERAVRRSGMGGG